MKRKFIAALFAFVVLLSAEAFAMDLSQARSSGLVGEKLDGYVGAVSSSPEANALVAEINARRRTEYQKISKENGQPIAIVGKVAAENIINGLPKGSLYQGANGNWNKK